MPACDYCEKHFGNEGALASHQAHCDEKPDGQAERQREPEPKPAKQPREEIQPAEEPQSQAPAVPDDETAVNAGMQLGESLAAMNSGDAEKQAQAKGSFFQTIGATVASAGKKIAQNQLKKTQEAKNRSGEQLQVSEEYPRCPECNGQITEIPPGGQEFSCPHCGTVLK